MPQFLALYGPLRRGQEAVVDAETAASPARWWPDAMNGLSGAVTRSCARFVMARSAQRVAAGLRLVRRAVPYQRELPEATHSVLVAGDSTAVGVGARQPRDGIAGLLGAEFPHVSVVNRGRHGARCRDVPAQLVSSEPRRFDVVLLLVGGNDILRGTGLEELTRDIGGALADAKRLAPHVVFVSTPDVGRVPMFPWPLTLLLSHRTRAARKVFIAAAREAGVLYIDLLAKGHSQRFMREPLRYFAADGLHPSTDSYRYCYDLLLQSTPLRAALSQACAAVPAALRDAGVVTPCNTMASAAIQSCGLGFATLTPTYRQTKTA